MVSRALNASLIPALLFVLASGSGCGREKHVDAAAEREGELIQVFEIYTLANKRMQKPPEAASDVTKKEYEQLYPSAVEGIKSGRFVVLWGTVVGGEDVLAYEKEAAQNGGMAVLANGNTKKLTADRIPAPKSKG